MAFLSFLTVGVPASSRLVYRPVYPQVIVSTGGDVAGGGHARRRRRERIIVRIDGEEIEVANVTELFRLLHKVKAEISRAARGRASEIIASGKRVADVRPAAPEIEVVEAPAIAREAIDDRIAEMDRMYWTLVQRSVERFLQDEEDVMLLLM